jgi:hypothetical protein
MASSALRYSITRYHSESDLDIAQCPLENGSAALAALEPDYPTDELTLVHYAMSVSSKHNLSWAVHLIGVCLEAFRFSIWVFGRKSLHPTV